jgi:hypothetical protein
MRQSKVCQSKVPQNMDSICEYRRTHARMAPGEEAHRPLHRDGFQSFPIRPASQFPQAAFGTGPVASVLVGNVQLAKAPERRTIHIYVKIGAGELCALHALCIGILHALHMCGAYVGICKLMLPSLALSMSGVNYRNSITLRIPRCTALQVACQVQYSSPLPFFQKHPRGLPGCWDPGCDRHCRVWSEERHSQSRTL